METTRLLIPNISCAHCVDSIRNELSEIEGVSKVTGDMTTKEITIEWKEPASLEKIKTTLKEISYPAAE